MVIFSRRGFLALSGFAFLAGCGLGQEWKTDYTRVVDPEVAKTWRISEIDVQVPETLTVSEANRYAPSADIVWRGETYGNRYEQVDVIITEAAELAGKGLKGSKPVRLVITVAQFHALTELTRYSLDNTGVHNIKFTAQVFDAQTNEPLTKPDLVQADLIAYSGTQAIAAEARGETQRKRIIDHVARTLSGWLGVGPDNRGSFKRAGR